MIMTYARRARELLIEQLKKGTTPHGLALSCALGVLCGTFPILGLCTVLSLFLSFFLEVNQPALQIVNQLMWPLHLALIPVFIYTGELLFQMDHVSLRPDVISRMLYDNPTLFFSKYGSSAGAAVAAWLIAAPLYSLGVYAISKLLLSRWLAK